MSVRRRDYWHWDFIKKYSLKDKLFEIETQNCTCREEYKLYHNDPDCKIHNVLDNIGDVVREEIKERQRELKSSIIILFWSIVIFVLLCIFEWNTDWGIIGRYVLAMLIIGAGFNIFPSRNETE